MKNLNVFVTAVILILSLLTACAGAGDYSIDLPGKLEVSRISGENIQIVSMDGEIGTNIVNPKVTEVGWNKNYVIAKQIEDEKEYYWIVDVKTEKAIGPFIHEDFLKKRKELQIPENVKLKKLEQYEQQYGNKNK